MDLPFSFIACKKAGSLALSAALCAALALPVALGATLALPAAQAPAYAVTSAEKQAEADTISATYKRYNMLYFLLKEA